MKDLTRKNKFMLYLKKATAWSIQHWRWLVFGSIALIAYLTGRKSAKNLWQQAELARKHYKAEAALIEKAHEDKNKKLEKADKNFKNKLTKIEKNKDEDLAGLETKKEEEQLSLVNDPEAVDNALNNIGINEV